MRLSKFPSCCGAGIVSDLDSNYYDITVDRIKEKLIKKLNTAKFERNYKFVFAIFAKNDNPNVVIEALESCKFKEKFSGKNPNSGNNIIFYVCDLDDLPKSKFTDL